jgi:hypothetical protein
VACWVGADASAGVASCAGAGDSRDGVASCWEGASGEGMLVCPSLDCGVWAGGFSAPPARLAFAPAVPLGRVVLLWLLAPAPLPGKAFAATAVNAPVSAALPAISQRLARARRRSAASRVRVLWRFWLGGLLLRSIAVGSSRACDQCAPPHKAPAKGGVRSSIEAGRCPRAARARAEQQQRDADNRLMRRLFELRRSGSPGLSRLPIGLC